MKRIIGLMGVVAFGVLATSADAKTMYAGVKGGVNIASLSGDGTDGLDSRNGFLGGVYYGVDFSADFGARIEGLYAMKGAEGELVIPGDDHEHETVLKLDYVEFPVLFVANFPVGEKVALNVMAGPTFAFNINAEADVHDETEDLSEVIESFEFGAAIGGGMKYKLSSMSIVLDARYSLGASNLAAVGDADLKTRGIGIMAGLEFPLGAK
jgi:hypothetical protein